MENPQRQGVCSCGLAGVRGTAQDTGLCLLQLYCNQNNLLAFGRIFHLEMKAENIPEHHQPSWFGGVLLDPHP